MSVISTAFVDIAKDALPVELRAGLSIEQDIVRDAVKFRLDGKDKSVYCVVTGNELTRANWVTAVQLVMASMVDELKRGGSPREVDLNYRNRKLLDLVNGHACINCGADDGTIVPAHSNQQVHGKGKSIKAHDCFFIPLCHSCHAWLDQGTGKDPTGIWDGTKEDKRNMFNACMHDWWLKMWRGGCLSVN